jgi:hypothetical protein
MFFLGFLIFLFKYFIIIYFDFIEIRPKEKGDIEITTLTLSSIDDKSYHYSMIIFIINQKKLKNIFIKS